MVSPSNPRLMTRILHTISNLQDGKGSYVRDILLHLRRSYSSTPRNLTMQVQRALNHAVNAGILRHQSGRYKVLFTLNPSPLKAETQETSDPKSAPSRSQNGIIKSGEKAITNSKSARQSKEQVSSKQVRVASDSSDRSEVRNVKGVQRESNKRTQRKSKESKEKNRVTRHSGVDVWKWRKKQRPKKLNSSKSKDPQEHQQYSSCSEKAADSDYDEKVPSKKSRRSEKGRVTPASIRARSRESRQISKEIPTSRKSNHEVGPVDSVESQPHLLLEPKHSTENILVQKVSDEHITINNNASLQDVEQDWKSNRSGSGSTL